MTAPFRSRPAVRPGGGEVPPEDGSAESLRSCGRQPPSLAPSISVESLIIRLIVSSPCAVRIDSDLVNGPC